MCMSVWWPLTELNYQFTYITLMLLDHHMVGILSHTYISMFSIQCTCLCMYMCTVADFVVPNLNTQWHTVTMSCIPVELFIHVTCVLYMYLGSTCTCSCIHVDMFGWTRSVYFKQVPFIQHNYYMCTCTDIHRIIVHVLSLGACEILRHTHPLHLSHK